VHVTIVCAKAEDKCRAAYFDSGLKVGERLLVAFSKECVMGILLNLTGMFF